MRRNRILRHGSWAVALAAVLVLSGQASRADDTYPGLPPVDDESALGSWNTVAQGGLSYAKRAQQWFRTPDGIVTARTGLWAETRADGITVREGADAEAYFVSPAGAPAPYGYLAPMTVRSVGFGLMPVEATVQVSQRREGGYPVPLRARLASTLHYAPGILQPVDLVASDTVVKDAFNIQILSVRVDGVDLGLTGDCRTVEPAPASLVGAGYTIPDPRAPNAQENWFRSHDPSTYYNPLWGGDLVGTMTIPPFVGCTTAAGDDLSALMTLSVSGPDNPISARSGWPCGFFKGGAGWPAAPGQSTPQSTMDAVTSDSLDPGCRGTKKFVYPERPAS
jgi:hypothetical protein